MDYPVATQEMTSVSVINDLELEGDHDFRIEISNISTLSNASIGSPSVATVTIHDDEG